MQSGCRPYVVLVTGLLLLIASQLHFMFMTLCSL
jgi:hypothetical protein